MAWPGRRELVVRLEHPNRMPFEGVLTLVDTISDRPALGSKDHLLMLTRTAVQNALPTLIGMPVSYKAGGDGHDFRQKVGIITTAKLESIRLVVSGYLFAKDFPELRTAFDGQEQRLGMSFELDDTLVEDMRART